MNFKRLRPDWDSTWMEVADTLALRSKCDTRQVGAVVVNSQNRIIATGYNGPPANLPGTDGKTCIDFCQRAQTGERGLSYGFSCPSIHAEANALIFADRRDYEGGTMYVTAACCQDCAKLIMNSGIARLVVRVDERDAHRNPYDTMETIRSCGIDIRTVE